MPCKRTAVWLIWWRRWQLIKGAMAAFKENFGSVDVNYWMHDGINSNFIQINSDTFFPSNFNQIIATTAVSVADRNGHEHFCERQNWNQNCERQFCDNSRKCANFLSIRMFESPLKVFALNGLCAVRVFEHCECTYINVTLAVSPVSAPSSYKCYSHSHSLTLHFFLSLSRAQFSLIAFLCLSSS